MITMYVYMPFTTYMQKWFTLRSIETHLTAFHKQLEWAESLIAIAWVTQCQHTQYMHNADWHWSEVCLIKQPFTKLHKDQMVETRYVGTVQKYCSVIPIYHFASKHVTMWTCIKTKAKKKKKLAISRSQSQGSAGLSYQCSKHWAIYDNLATTHPSTFTNHLRILFNYMTSYG